MWNTKFSALHELLNDGFYSYHRIIWHGKYVAKMFSLASKAGSLGSSRKHVLAIDMS